MAAMLHARRHHLPRDVRQERLVSAAWQLEDTLRDRHVPMYPRDLRARELHLEAAQADHEYQTALKLMVLLTIFETPAWCTTDSDLWANWDPNSRCSIEGVPQDEVLLSNLPYMPPGWGVLMELCILFVIARKLLLDRKLQLWYFEPIKINYNEKSIIRFGLWMVLIEMVDCVIFIFLRPNWRLAFISRTGFLLLLPEVRRLLVCVYTVIGEIVFIAIFYIGTIFFFAWIAVTLFKDSTGEFFGKEVKEGLDTFSHSLNTMFVAGSTEEFLECFLPTYTKYRSSGLIWLLFLVVVQLLLLNLVLDTIVAAYMRHQEETEESAATSKVKGILKAYEILDQLEHEEGMDVSGQAEAITKDTFLAFAGELSRSPSMTCVTPSTAEILFTAIDKDGSGEIDRGEFCSICGVIEYDFWTTTMNSPVEHHVPWLWNSKAFSWFRLKVRDGHFDTFMDHVLLLNLGLIMYETVRDLNDMPDQDIVLNLELAFSLVYVMEVGLKLCVTSWGNYWSSRSNQFDFMVTWLLLVSSILDDMLSSSGASDVKRYMNILRLMRLLRMLKQLNRSLPVVQRMVETIGKLVLASKDILKMLGVVCFFFSALGTQLFGGLLYKSNPALEGTEYEEKNFFVLNFNDFMMSFGVWVVMLLCEYVAIFPDTISQVSDLPGVWLVFLVFYILGVSIIFELVKAFTIEVFMELRSKWGKQEMQFKTLDKVIEECHLKGQELHSRVSGDLRSKEKIMKMFKKMYQADGSSDGESSCGSEKHKH